LKILIVIPEFPYPVTHIRGGIHSAVLNLLQGMSHYPVEIIVLTFRHRAKDTKTVPFTEKIKIVYAPEGPFPFSSPNFLFFGSKILQRVIREFGPDIVHYQAGGTFYLTKFPGIQSAHELITIHGIARAEARVSRSLKFKLIAGINAILTDLLMPRHVINISRYSLNLMKQKRGTNTRVIPNAVSSRFFEQPLRDNTENQLLYIGVINDRKNLFLLLEAMKQLNEKQKRYCLEVCGGFEDPSYEQKIRQYITDHHLDTQVHFRGWVAQDRMAAEIAANDFLVLPSKQETLPMVIAETMSAGRFVVASDAGGIPEMIHHGKDGYIFPVGDRDKLVSILDLLFDNQAAVRELGKQARQTALDTYDSRKVAADTLAFYQEICGRPV
jgi:glycosyltransferase involved in cell wall biosynthesis